MGNVLKDGIEGAWNSEKYQKFRETIKKGDVPYIVCKSCNPQKVSDMVATSKISSSKLN